MGRRYNGIRTAEGKVCTVCGQIKPFGEYYKTSKHRDGLAAHCKSCWKKRQNEKYQAEKGPRLTEGRNQLKSFYVDKMGGECFRCGYAECLAGLDFHHTEDKEHSVADLLTRAVLGTGQTINIARLETELAKCIVLCRNCHAALHVGFWSLPGQETKSLPRLEPEIEYRTDELAYLPLFAATDN